MGSSYAFVFNSGHTAVISTAERLKSYSADFCSIIAVLLMELTFAH